MISYDPFFDFLEENDIQLEYLRKNKILSSQTISRMRERDSLTLETIEKLCFEFRIPIDKIVTILNDEGKPFDGGKAPSALRSTKGIIGRPSNKKSLQTNFESSKRKKYQIENLKFLRKKTNYTQEDVATHIGIAKLTVGLWERDKLPVYEDYLEPLKTLLNIPEEAIREIK